MSVFFNPDHNARFGGIVCGVCLCADFAVALPGNDESIARAQNRVGDFIGGLSLRECGVALRVSRPRWRKVAFATCSNNRGMGWGKRESGCVGFASLAVSFAFGICAVLPSCGRAGSFGCIRYRISDIIILCQQWNVKRKSIFVRCGKAENDRQRLDFGETSGRGCGMMEIQKDPDWVKGGIV